MNLSQEALVLHLLKKAGKHGLENYKFSHYRILSHSKVLSNLRAQGFPISKERVLLPNGRSTGVYKYYLNTPSKKWWER